MRGCSSDMYSSITVLGALRRSLNSLKHMKNTATNTEKRETVVRLVLRQGGSREGN